MSLFVRHACPDLPPGELIALVLGAQAHVGSDFRVTPMSGGELAGRATVWVRWSLRPGVAPVSIPSVLHEGDPDDAPFVSAGGLMAMPSGSRTAYVYACGPADQDEGGASRSVKEAAESPIFAPRGDRWEPCA